MFNNECLKWKWNYIFLRNFLVSGEIRSMIMNYEENNENKSVDIFKFWYIIESNSF